MEILFFDLETTGVDTKTDRIVEICMILKDMETGSTQTYKTLVNPTIPIPAGASDVHGITDEKVKDAPKFSEIAETVHKALGKRALCGFNSNAFDVPFLFNELERAGIKWDWKAHKLIDAGNIFKKREPRTLSAASIFYTGSDHTNAHEAESDVICTINVLESQMNRYGIPLDQLEEESLMGGKPVDINRYFVYDENEEIIINFGKHKGQKAKDQKSYLSWMLSSNFPSDTHEVCRQFIS